MLENSRRGLDPDAADPEDDEASEAHDLAPGIGTSFPGSTTGRRDQLEPVAELDGAGNVVSRFVYATKGHSPDYMLRDGHTYRIVSDHLGSPRLVIDVDSGAVAQRMDFDEWGVVTLDTNPGFNPFGFSGGLLDADTGLTRFGAPDYAAAEGRWTAKDPIGFTDLGLFNYAYNDPVNFADVTGREPGEVFGTADAAAQDAIDYIYQQHPGDDVEYGGFIRDEEDGFTYDEPRPGTPRNFQPGVPGSGDLAVFHSHGCEDAGWFGRRRKYEKFSGEGESFPKRDTDVGWAQLAHMPVYLGTPRGAVREVRPDPLTNLPIYRDVRPPTDPTGENCACTP